MKSMRAQGFTVSTAAIKSLLMNTGGKIMSEYRREPLRVLEKLSYEQLLLAQISRCLEMIPFSYNLFEGSVIALFNMIPLLEREKDEEFQKEVEAAKIKLRFLTGKYRGFGGMRTEIVRKVEHYNAYSLFNACVNFLHRRKMLWTEITKEFWE